MKNLALLTPLLINLLTGCVADEPNTASASQHLVTDNGVRLNGVRLNGVRLNGVSLNGVRLNGVRLNGVRLNGVGLNGVGLNGYGLDGAVITGSSWTGNLSDGSQIALRIDSATTGSGANSDVGMYAVSYQTSGDWEPLCGLDGAAPVLALAVAGTWNEITGAYTASGTEFSFACRGVTVAKCVEYGYKTWTGHTEQLTSCARMLRGDYCGDGVPHTADGTTLNVYDNAGLEADTESWPAEAEWTPAGARCISADQNTRFHQQLGQARPACLNGKVIPSCGTSFDDGAVLITELPPVN